MTQGGGKHKLFKYKVHDDLTINISPYEYCEGYAFETWEQTVARMESSIRQNGANALSVIRRAISDYPNHKKVAFTSTGKDSMVVLDLVKYVMPDVKVYFNNTTLDTADTYNMVKAHKDWTVINPDIGFYQYVKQARYVPTRFSRGCCTMFKEGKTIEFFDNEPQMLYFMGVRNDESNARTDRQDISHNPKWGNRDWFSCLPIRTWSEFDVWLYILKHKLEINPKYRKGYGRVGCSVACCYYTKYTWVLDKYWYRQSYDRWREILHKDFVQEQRWTKLNCTVAEYVKDGWNGGLYRPEPTEEVVEEFMIYKGLTDYNVALQYFNKTCECCNNKDAKGLKRSFRIYQVVKQIIVDLQEWNKPVFSERDRNALLKWAVEYGGIDIDTFCNEFASCSIGHNNVRQKIAEIINTTECPPLWRHW